MSDRETEQTRQIKHDIGLVLDRFTTDLQAVCRKYGVDNAETEMVVEDLRRLALTLLAPLNELVH